MSDLMNFEALATIGLGPWLRRQLAFGIADPTALPMRVVEVQRDHLLLHDGRQALRGHVAIALARDLDDQGEALAVGDWVLAQPGGPLGWRITVRLPPGNQITRRTLDGRAGDGRRIAQRQVLVSNVDTVLLVMGLDADFNPRRLERYLALARLAGVDAVLVLSKADTVPEAVCFSRQAQARAVLPASMAVLALDMRQPEACLALAPWLQPGQTLVLLGSSGAGKSTLANTLCAGPQRQATGPARADDSRGRHTTTVRSLLPLPGGACIIDTPGLRALRLDVVEADDLAHAFGDVARLAPQCRFRNCQHQAEPGCAVQAAVDAPRLRNFHKLLREAERDVMSPAQRQAQVSRWKARGRDAQMRLRAKRGEGG